MVRTIKHTLIAILAALTMLGTPSVLPAQELATSEELPSISSSAPTLPGAPFLPSQDRTSHVLARYDALTALTEVQRAHRNLTLRLQSKAGDRASDPAIADTERILLSQIDQLTREVERLEETATPLLEETEQFGLGLAIFPVDQARKPFWDDWHQPRSGGRLHVGTDVLAQVGVPLRAIEDGEVESITSGGLGGNGIFLLGDSGSRYLYVHMDTVEDFEPGERVLAGQPVGTVGDTGNARGAPHLHMQWDPDGGSDWQNAFPLLDVLFGAGRTEQMAIDAALALEAGAG